MLGPARQWSWGMLTGKSPPRTLHRQGIATKKSKLGEDKLSQEVIMRLTS